TRAHSRAAPHPPPAEEEARLHPGEAGGAPPPMIVPDVNLLVYAHMAAFPQHDAARTWWEALLNGRTEVGIGSPALFGFVRLATNRKIFDPPMAIGAALACVE